MLSHIKKIIFEIFFVKRLIVFFKSLAVKKDSREHERYTLSNENAASVIFSDSYKTPILNISYGGLAIESLGPYANSDKLVFDVHLQFLGRKVSVKIVKIYEQNFLCGFRFDHQDGEALFFLREIIQYLHYGRSMIFLRKELLNDKYHASGWHCLRGEGPTDLVFRTDNNSELKEFLLTFRLEGKYHELKFKDGHYTTGFSSDTEEGSTIQIKPTKDLDPETILYATQILLGFTHSKVVPLLEKVVVFGLSFLEDDEK